MGDPLITQDAPLHLKMVVQYLRERALVKIGILHETLVPTLNPGQIGIQKLSGAFKAEIGGVWFCCPCEVSQEAHDFTEPAAHSLCFHVQSPCCQEDCRVYEK